MVSLHNSTSAQIILILTNFSISEYIIPPPIRSLPPLPPLILPPPKSELPKTLKRILSDDSDSEPQDFNHNNNAPSNNNTTNGNKKMARYSIEVGKVEELNNQALNQLAEIAWEI